MHLVFVMRACLHLLATTVKYDRTRDCSLNNTTSLTTTTKENAGRYS